MLQFTFSLNGRRRTVSVEGRTTLLEMLRESFLLTGSKEACGVGKTFFNLLAVFPFMAVHPP